MKKPETKIVRQIITTLCDNYPKGYFRKIHGNPFQHAGITDIIGCIQGYFIGLEVKTSTGKTSKIQDLEGLEINQAEGIYSVVTSSAEALEVVRYMLSLKK
jgi:hypothetical protein